MSSITQTNPTNRPTPHVCTEKCIRRNCSKCSQPVCIQEMRYHQCMTKIARNRPL